MHCIPLVYVWVHSVKPLLGSIYKWYSLVGEAWNIWFTLVPLTSSHLRQVVQDWPNQLHQKPSNNTSTCSHWQPNYTSSGCLLTNAVSQYSLFSPKFIILNSTFTIAWPFLALILVYPGDPTVWLYTCPHFAVVDQPLLSTNMSQYPLSLPLGNSRRWGLFLSLLGVVQIESSSDKSLDITAWLLFSGCEYNVCAEVSKLTKPSGLTRSVTIQLKSASYTFNTVTTHHVFNCSVKCAMQIGTGTINVRV